MVPVAYEEIAVTAAAAVGLTEATLDSLAANNTELAARILVCDYPIAWLEHGGTPTAATKQQAGSGSYILLYSLAAMRKFLAIGLSSTAYLAVQYFKQ